MHEMYRDHNDGTLSVKHNDNEGDFVMMTVTMMKVFV